MGTDISLFSGYSQKENRTTNYCLLVLKLLYEENPKFLGEALAGLVGEDLADIVGVQFRQQARKKTSVPDGVVVQQAFTLYIETKNWDWFSDAQLEQHLAGLDAEKPGPKVLIALSNFEALPRDRFARVEALCSGKYEVELGRVEEELAGLLDEEGPGVEAGLLAQLLLREDSGLRRLERAVEATEHRERQDDLAVLGLLVVAAEQVCDGPDEGGEVRVRHAGRDLSEGARRGFWKWCRRGMQT